MPSDTLPSPAAATTTTSSSSSLKKSQLGRKLGSLFRRKVTSHFKHDEVLLSQLLKHVKGKVLVTGSNLPLVLKLLQFPTVSHVVAIAPDASHHNELRQAAKASKLPIAILGSSIEAVDFKDASFDSIIVTHTFSSVSDPEAVLKKGYRWLSPGGSLHILAHLEPHPHSSKRRSSSSSPKPAEEGAKKPLDPKTEALGLLESFSWDKGSEFAIFYRRHRLDEDPVPHLMGTAKKPAF